ncbi:helix-turn-helix domain-containing protein [Deinococcus sp. Marseille-Q6407]|uniref:helix-turn-helix domain-containing protein n=1 Tax=Deinococcus sp. Marseille-Q6407 TaxID=2969223 RepID=UPI0021BF63AC|nr:helix-turn-helix transcriptional regulator [Deinococcus sp. Marseille-Q6407]
MFNAAPYNKTLKSCAYYYLVVIILGMRPGTAIKKIREARGLSQQELAARLKISQSRISQVENRDDEDLMLGTLRSFAEALGVSVALLVDESMFQAALPEVATKEGKEGAA